MANESSLPSRRALNAVSPSPIDIFEHNQQASRSKCGRLNSYMRSIHDFWYRIQLSHQGKYSLERLEAFIDHCNRTSLLKSLLMCLYAPLPSILVVLGLESIPIKSPSASWEENWAFWIRTFLTILVVSLSEFYQGWFSIPDLNLSHFHIVMLSMLTTTASAGTVFIAAQITFPTPFAIVASGVPWAISAIVGTVFTIGIHRVRTEPELRMQLKQHFLIFFVQMQLTFIYPTYRAMFAALSSNQQVAFVALLPGIKLFMKNLLAWAGSHSEDAKPELVTMSVQLFNALYVSTCIQTADSTLSVAFIMLLDCIHSIMTLRDIHNNTKSIQMLLRDQGKDHENLLAVVDQYVKESDIAAYLVRRDIRISSTVHHSLTEHRQKYLTALTHKASKLPKVKSTKKFIESKKRRSSAFISRATPVFKQEVKVVSCDSTIQGTCRNSSGQNILIKSRRNNKVQVIDETLTLMFRVEVTALTEYVECLIPFMYSIYVIVVFHVPSAVYHPQIRDLDSSRVVLTTLSILMYASLELVSFILLHFLIKRKFHFSPFHLLTFVIETHWWLIQSRLFLSVTYVLLHTTLEHYGNDFTFEFIWLTESTNDTNSSQLSG